MSEQPEVKIDNNGVPYILITREISGEEVPVKIYGEQGKRPKQFVR